MKNYKIDLGAIVARARSAQLRASVSSAVAEGEAIRKGIHFDQPTSVKNHEVKQPNHYYIFCSHEIPYWRPCTKCRRDKELAKRNADLVLKACGGAAFFTK